MVSPEHRKQSLPRVEQTDLLSLVFEDVMDPTHKGWWEQFATDNPVLARQMLVRAYVSGTESLSSLEVQKRIIGEVTFAIRALYAAAERQLHSDDYREVSELTAGGDGDDEGRPLSA